jgi:hypothetical protein
MHAGGEDIVNVKGKVIYEDNKYIKGTIAFFDRDKGIIPDPIYYTKVPDEVLELRSDGSFEGTIKQAKYYVGIILNNTGKKGPFKIGDRFYLLKKDDKIFEVDLTNIKSYDFNNISIYPFELKEFKFKTAIKGWVVDENNKPLSNVYVFAFLEGKNSKKPVYVSEPTDGNGIFLLRLGGGGRYILRVRNIIDGGPPKKGYITGTYGQHDNPNIIDVKDGEIISNIEIVANTF